jgi:hypothetical protein
VPEGHLTVIQPLGHALSSALRGLIPQSGNVTVFAPQCWQRVAAFARSRLPLPSARLRRVNREAAAVASMPRPIGSPYVHVVFPLPQESLDPENASLAF